METIDLTHNIIIHILYLYDLYCMMIDSNDRIGS